MLFAPRLFCGLSALIAALASWVHADTLYLETFDGPATPVSLNGLAPDVRPSNGFWTAAESLYADGSSDTGQNTAWLPLSVEEDEIYTVTFVSDVLYSSGSTTPFGVSFTTASSFGTASPGVATSRGFLKVYRGGSWEFYDEGASSAVAGGPGNILFSSSQSGYELTLVLTTCSTGAWTIDAYAGGVQLDLAPFDGGTMSHEFASPPVMTGAGFYNVSKTGILRSFQIVGPAPLVTVEPTSRVVDVFLLAGQSNMSGRVDTGYSEDPRDSESLFYYRTDGPAPSDVDSGGEFTTIQPLASGYYGPEISMARALVDKGYRVAVIKVSDGGTSMDADWNPVTFGRCWKYWLSDVKHALKTLEDMGYAVRLRGFCWLQGETDATNEARANHYEGLFAELLENVEAHLIAWGYDVSDLQMVCALIRSGSGSYAEVVRAAQESVMTTRGNGEFFDTEDLTMQPDDLHYDVSSISTIGSRFAAHFPPIEGYGDWTSANGLSGPDALPTADPDGNGLSNLAEYALGIDHGAIPHQPRAERIGIDLSLTHPLLRQDVAYLPEWSENLLQWYTHDLSIDRSPTEVVALKSLSGCDRLFMRLSMELE